MISIRKILSIRVGSMEIPPSETLLIIVRFSIISILVLATLEIIHILAFKSWNSETFAAISTSLGKLLESS